MAVTTTGKNKIETGARLYVGGYDLSGDMRTIGAASMVYDPVDVTGWSDRVKNGFVSWATAELTGYQALMNDATGGAYTQLILTAGAQTGSRLSLCLGGAGAAPIVGDPAFLMPSVEIGDNVAVAGHGILQGDFNIDAGQASGVQPHGVVLRGDTSLSATLTGSSTNSHDFEGATANGWHANIHVLATASGNFVFKIRHSADDSAWADLGTFTTTGGTVGSEFLSGTGTVNQYIAFDATRTAGTVTVIVTFARN